MGHKDKKCNCDKPCTETSVGVSFSGNDPRFQILTMMSNACMASRVANGEDLDATAEKLAKFVETEMIKHTLMEKLLENRRAEVDDGKRDIEERGKLMLTYLTVSGVTGDKTDSFRVVETLTEK